MATLSPYLLFKGNCEEVFRYYVECLGGKIVSLQRFGETPDRGSNELKNQIMHLRYEREGAVIMGSDCRPEDAPTQGDSIYLCIDFSDPILQEKQFMALSRGGKIESPLQDTFWGARFGMLTDRFGVHWMFNCPKS